MNIVNRNIKGSSDKISINFSEQENFNSLSAVRVVKDDKGKNYGIKDISEKGIALKEVGYGIDGFGKNKTIYTDSESNQGVLKEQLEKQFQNKDDSSEKVQDEKKSAERIKSRITAKDYKQLMAEGNIQEAYDVVRLDKALSRIKSQRQERRAGIEKQVERFVADKEAMSQVAYKTHNFIGANEDVGALLEEANLPITEENIVRLATAIDLASRLGEVSDQDISYMIHNNLKPTIGNLYKASYSNMPEDVFYLSEEDKEQLYQQIDTILEEAGHEHNIENREKAIWLIEHKLPLTKENIASLDQFYGIRKSMNMPDYQTKIIDKIVGSMEDGIAPEQTLLSVISDEINQFMDTIRESSENALKVAVQLEEEVTVSNLEKANRYIKANHSVKFEVDEGKYITAKRQLEEIRLKMTADVAGKMADKGIQLNTTELSKLVEELKVIENNYYGNFLKEENGIDSSENILLLQETTQVLEELKTVPSYVLGLTLDKKDTGTLLMIQKEGQILRTQLEKANERYETLMTEPRRDLGDSMNKAFSSIDSILAELELEATQGNQRAVRILGYNNMEITKESIQEVKVYDTMMNRLMKDMHPAVVVNMIREGENPLDIPLEELSQKVNQSKEELGITEEEKYSTYLRKLEHEDKITPEERKSYIGIYRLLNNVEKTNGAVLGSIINADQEITLNNLLTAVRTMKNKSMDIQVDDEYGALEELVYSKENITIQIETGFEQNQKKGISDSAKQQVDYTTGLLNQIMEDISPGKLSAIAESLKSNSAGKNGMEQLLDLSVENLYEEMQMVTEDEKITELYYSERAEQVRETLDNINIPLTLLNNLNMPATLNHIAAAKEYLYHQDKKTFAKLYDVMKSISDKGICNDMKKVMAHFPEAVIDEESMESEYNKINEATENLINKALESPDITAEKITYLKDIHQGMKLITALSKARNYEVPLLVGNRITHVNLKIISGTEKMSKVEVKVQSETMGNVEASFSVKGEEIKGLLLSDNREGLNQLKNNQDDLAEKIQEKGLILKQLDYGSYQYNSNPSVIAEEMELGKSSDTSQLYEVAKVLLYHIKNIEEQNIEQY